MSISKDGINKHKLALSPFLHNFEMIMCSVKRCFTMINNQNPLISSMSLFLSILIFIASFCCCFCLLHVLCLFGIVMDQSPICGVPLLVLNWQFLAPSADPGIHWRLAKDHSSSRIVFHSFVKSLLLSNPCRPQRSLFILLMCFTICLSSKVPSYIFFR